jgi:hypothetical protein
MERTVRPAFVPDIMGTGSIQEPEQALRRANQQCNDPVSRFTIAGSHR